MSRNPAAVLFDLTGSAYAVQGNPLHATGSLGVTNEVRVTTTGSLPVVVQSLPNVSGAVHVTNAQLNVTGTVGIGGPVAAQVTNFPTVQQVWDPGTKAISGSVSAYTSGPQAVSGSVSTYTQGPQLVSGTILVSGSVATYTHGPQLISGTVAVSGSVAVYTQGPQLVSGTVAVSGSVAVYTQGPQNVTGSVAVYTQGPQNVTGSVSVFTQGAQLVSGTVNLGNWPPVIAVSGSQVTGSTFHGYPVVVGGLSGSSVRTPAVVEKEPAADLFALVTRMLEVTRPTFHAVFDRIAPASNKYMATLWNGASGRKVVVQRIWRYNWQVAAVTGVNLDQELRFITARTAGTTVTPVPLDSADVLTSGIVADHASTSVSDAELLMRLAAVSEERDVLDTRVVDWLALQGFALIYERKPNTRGIVLRQNRGLTVKNVTASTVGTVSYVIEFTDEAA